MIQFLARIQRVVPIGRSGSGTFGATEDERRRNARSLALFWGATLRTHEWTGPAIVIEISSTGMRLRSQHTPARGSQIRVEFPGVLLIQGEVRWSDAGRLGVELREKINVIEVMRAHRKASGSHLGVDVGI